MSSSTDADPFETPTGRRHFAKSRFFNEVMHGILGPRKGGAKVLVDAENSRLGVGKTSAAVALARFFSTALGYEFKKEDLTLSANEYLQRYREHPDDQPSVIILDEMVGAGGGDARRFMSNKNVHLARAWQLQRTKQVITFTTLPNWADADKRLRKLADYRVYVLEKPVGFFKPYRLGTWDFKENSGVNFRRLDPRIKFPPVDDDPLYQYVSELKDDLIHSDSYDADELQETAEEGDSLPGNTTVSSPAKSAIKDLYENEGWQQQKIADKFEITQQRVSQIVNAD